jgi:hypothetical protein
MIFCVPPPVCATLTSANDLGESIFVIEPRRTELRLLPDLVISPYFTLFPWLGFYSLSEGAALSGMG